MAPQTVLSINTYIEHMLTMIASKNPLAPKASSQRSPKRYDQYIQENNCYFYKIMVLKILDTT